MKDDRRQELERLTKLLGMALNQEMLDASTGPPLGYMLVVFDFDPGGFMTYASNAERIFTIPALMRELASKLEGN